jgi:vacuolar-type H+-ATPase subunit F/Vma7
VGRVAVIGEEVAVAGYALAGALVLPAEDDAAVRDAWSGLPEGIDLVVLTRRAADALGATRTADPSRLTAVLPP